MARVSALWRHPIKSHGREALQSVTLTKGQTMPWDRRWAVAHALAKSDGSEWVPNVNYSRGSKVPVLMAINARTDEVTGRMAIATNPETSMRDTDTLGTLKTNWSHQNFGVYAEVTGSGEITIGDKVEVL